MKTEMTRLLKASYLCIVPPKYFEKVLRYFILMCSLYSDKFYFKQEKMLIDLCFGLSAPSYHLCI